MAMTTENSDNKNSRLDKDIENALKAEALREALEDWAPKTRLDRDVEIAIKNRALRQQMALWQKEVQEPQEIVPFWQQMRAYAYESRRTIMRVAAVALVVIVAGVPYFKVGHTDLADYNSECNVYSSMSSTGRRQDDDAIEKMRLIEQKLKNKEFAEARHLVAEVRLYANDDREFLNTLDWYDALSTLQMDRLKDKVAGKRKMKKIANDPGNLYQKEANKILEKL